MKTLFDETKLGKLTLKNLNAKIMPKAITVEQIKHIQTKFAEAALRAKNAGGFKRVHQKTRCFRHLIKVA